MQLPLPSGKSLGLSGGLYNRMQATFTKFMQLPFLPQLTEKDVWIDRKVGLVGTSGQRACGRKIGGRMVSEATNLSIASAVCLAGPT